MTRFVRMFRYDPVAEPGARIRLDYDPDDGLAILYDEDVLPEHANKPDVSVCSRVNRTILSTTEVRWLASQFSELAPIMEADEADCTGVPTIDGIPQHEPAPAEEIEGIPEPVDAKFDDSDRSKL